MREVVHRRGGASGGGGAKPPERDEEETSIEVARAGGGGLKVGGKEGELRPGDAIGGGGIAPVGTVSGSIDPAAEAATRKGRQRHQA
jgi:hypothetical protein